MAELLRFATAESRPREPGEFVLTETARDIMRSLDWVRSSPGIAMTMIAGVPGAGKTRALQHFVAQEGYDAIYLKIANGEGKPTAIAANIMRMFNVDVNGMSLSSMRDTVSQCLGRGRVLILDEAEYLEQQGAEWVRAVAETRETDLVLCGDLTLRSMVAKLDKLDSRIDRRVIIKSVCRADVEAFVAGTPFATGVMVETLHGLAKKRGGLRSVDNVIRLAFVFAGSDPATEAHLKAAIHDMKLAPKGAAL